MEGVKRIPSRIGPGDFVCKKLYQIHHSGRTDDKRIGQYFQMRRQHDITGEAEQAQHEDGGVKIEPAGPSCTQRQGDCTGQFIE